MILWKNVIRFRLLYTLYWSIDHLPWFARKRLFNLLLPTCHRYECCRFTDFQLTQHMLCDTEGYLSLGFNRVELKW